MARRSRVRFETGRSRNSARVPASPQQTDASAPNRQPKPGTVRVIAYTPEEQKVLRDNARLLAQRRQRDARPRVVEPKLPKAESLTERDLARLEAAARRQLDRNRRQLEGT